MRKRETAVCGTACTVVWEVGKCESKRQMPFMISIYLLPDLHGGEFSLPMLRSSVVVKTIRMGMLLAVNAPEGAEGT